MKVYIWGTGKYGKKVLHAIQRDNCVVKGFIDNNPDKRGKTFENIETSFFRDIDDDYDFIIISVINYEAVLYQLELEGCRDFSKIIVFFREECCNNPQFEAVINQQEWRFTLLEYKVEKMQQIGVNWLNNIGYEIIDKYNKNLYQYPKIGATEDAIEKIVNERCSLARFGDGEFEIMAGNERAVFQKYNPVLAERLKEVISSGQDQLLIAIANNYGNLDQYNENSAHAIREYMTDKVRDFHLSLLEKDRVYYDTYMFKSYFPYKNREDTRKRVELVKKIWQDRDIVLIEGDKTRTGYGNDLFDNVKSLRRILCPTQNAFDQYEEILNTVLKIDKNIMLLIVLGPAAKVLVYDLFQRGYQAIDIGQIDMDYEWYLAGAQRRVPIPDKYVSQLPPAEIVEVDDAEYMNQVIEHII